MGVNTDWQAPSEPNPHRKKPWGLVVALVAIAAVLIAAAIVLIPRLSQGAADQPAAGREVALPGEVLLASLREKPVPGWRINLSDLLPGAKQPLRANLFDYIGEKAFFTLRSDDGRSWLLGVDVKQGSSLFPPIEFPDSAGPDCFVNGPNRVLCLNTISDRVTGGGSEQVEIWVVDTGNGAVVAHGPTDLRASITEPPLYTVNAVGDYAVARQDGVGWYGLGDHGERTWFVPGSGAPPRYTLDKLHFPGNPVSNLVGDQDGDGLVFSAQDGRVFPHVPGWVEPVIGGFVVMDDQSPSAFHFYGNDGTKTGEYRPQDGESAEIATGNGQRVVVTLSKIGSSDATQLIFTPTGQLITETKTHSLGDAIRFIGNYMYAGPDNTLDPNIIWNKYDLTTGKNVSACSGMPLARTDLIGSDGTVVLGDLPGPTPSDTFPAAVDTNTCTRLWELPSRTPLWTVGTTLLQAVPESNEIISLVPPG